MEKKEFREGLYVEGIVIFNRYKDGMSILGKLPELIHHAWIELQNEIIDVTLADKSVMYFPCNKFNFTKAEEIFNEYGYLDAPFFEYQEAHKTRSSYKYPEKWKSKFNDAIDFLKGEEIYDTDTHVYLESLYKARGLYYYKGIEI